jgi:hypothetical protein
MAHFYLILPSNSSMSHYPNNTVAHFTTKLENAISLSGQWEAALIELQYPHTWHNVQSGQGDFTYVQIPKRTDINAARHSVQHLCQIPAGYYENVEDVVRAVNAKIEDVVKLHALVRHPKFKYDRVTKRLTGKINLAASIIFSSHLCKIFGMGESRSAIENINYGRYLYEERFEDYIKAWDEVPDMDWISEKVCNINPAFSCIYVYCNILESVVLGDAKAPLLRVVNIDGESGDSVHVMYENAMYVQLQQKSFESIEIYMRGDNDKPIPFEHGKSFVILHFRQCSTL